MKQCRLSTLRLIHSSVTSFNFRSSCDATFFSAHRANLHPRARGCLVGRCIEEVAADRLRALLRHLSWWVWPVAAYGLLKRASTASMNVSTKKAWRTLGSLSSEMIDMSYLQWRLKSTLQECYTLIRLWEKTLRLDCLFLNLDRRMRS